MAKAPQTKNARNRKLVELKAKMTFENLARLFNISETRVKQIYYRELQKTGGTSPYKKRDYWKGKNLSFQHKKKISDANKGRKHSQATKEKIKHSLKVIHREALDRN
jgi:hypothetical protein